MSVYSLSQIFDQFNQLKVLIIGDVMIDAYIWGNVDRISPEAPVPVVRTIKRDYRLGGAANVGLNVKALGADPVICAVVGKDNGGKQFIQRLAEHNMSADGLVQSTTRPTTIKTRIIAANQHLARIDEETDASLDTAEKTQLLENISKHLPGSRVVIFEDYDKGCIDADVIKFTVDLAREHGIPTVVDPKKRNFLDYKHVTLFKPNLKELREGLKIEIESGQINKLDQATEKLRKMLKCNGSLITLSEHGVYIQTDSDQHHIPAHLREIADVSGAGDTVISVAGLAIALGLPAKMVASLANLAGGLVCQHVGVVSVDKDELLKEALDKLEA